MTKKIARIILSGLALLGLGASVFFTAINFPKNYLLKTVAFSGLGITFPLISTVQEISQKNGRPPYTYLNLPLDRDRISAFTLYDSLVSSESPAVGQDPPPPQDSVTPTIPEGAFPVIALDMSDNQTINNLLCKNESKYTPDINALAVADYPVKFSQTVSVNNPLQPTVLIIHTHGTECYLPDGMEYYTADTPTRTSDTNLNVVAIGRVFADELTKKGISVIHCETMFDEESYSQSYDLSEKAVLEYLAEYPSIQYVFDIHRDSITRENNEKIKPVTTVNGTKTAQAMFVVGTDSSGADHPNWINNLTVASHFQYTLTETYGNILRPLNLRSASFNAEHAPGSVLIEIGTCGNTVSEAKNCAVILGQTIADIILTDGK